MIDTLSFPGVLFCPCGRLEALFRAVMDFPACATKRPGNAHKTPYTPALTICITSLPVSHVRAALPALK